MSRKGRIRLGHQRSYHFPEGLPSADQLRCVQRRSRRLALGEPASSPSECHSRIGWQHILTPQWRRAKIRMDQHELLRCPRRIGVLETKRASIPRFAARASTTGISRVFEKNTSFGPDNKLAIRVPDGVLQYVQSRPVRTAQYGLLLDEQCIVRTRDRPSQQPTVDSVWIEVPVLARGLRQRWLPSPGIHLRCRFTSRRLLRRIDREFES